MVQTGLIQRYKPLVNKVSFISENHKIGKDCAGSSPRSSPSGVGRSATIVEVTIGPGEVICNERAGDDWGMELGSKQAVCLGCHVCVLSESKSMVMAENGRGSQSQSP